jgi:urea transport system permease protein
MLTAPGRWMVKALIAAVLLPAVLHAASEDELRAAMLQLAKAKPANLKAAIEKLAQMGDARLAAFFENYNKDNVYLWKERIVVVTDVQEVNDEKIGKPRDPLTNEPVTVGGKDAAVPMSEMEEVSPGRARGAVRDALMVLRLSDPDRETRLSAIVKCGDSGQDANIPFLKSILEREQDAKVRAAIDESVLRLQLFSADEQVRITAAEQLGKIGSARALSQLKEMLKPTDARAKPPTEKEAQAFTAAINAIESWQSVGRGFKYVFDGLSLGSILILMALGLSIIFGLMGVINMAHGEFMMIGAYATYATQLALASLFPNTYFIIAIPISFVVAAIVGFLVEFFVIRHLYGRPLDTMLATWGVSMILIQIARLKFGDNVGVSSPTWLQGGAEIMQGVVLPYNRCFIIGFCLFCILLIYFIIEHTKLGLLLRATTQNRGMAASLGVKTRRIDGYTFALGAGLAGMAGCAITLTDGVRPDMGQNYVVDSFLVVVAGGVGKLAGAIIAGLGLGSLNKFFEPVYGAVWAKVLVLVCMILFIQWKPSGLFPAKGRTADV